MVIKDDAEEAGTVGKKEYVLTGKNKTPNRKQNGLLRRVIKLTS